MAAFLPIAVLMSLLVTGTTAGGYGSQMTPSTSTPASYTQTHDDDKKLLQEVVVRVEGLVLCQSCAKRGTENLEGATLLPKAKVVVTCRDSKNRVMAYRCVDADDNGYFHAEFGVQRPDAFWCKEPREACFVRLLSSPNPECNIVTNIHGGIEGAPLRDEGKHWIDDRGFKNNVYAAGPLAFMPAMCAPTLHY